MDEKDEMLNNTEEEEEEAEYEENLEKIAELSGDDEE